jgi:hypothetical protein
VVDNFLYLDGFWLSQDDWVTKIDLFNNSVLYSLNNGTIDKLLDGDNSLMNNWNGDNFLYLFWYLFDDFDWNLHLFNNLYNFLLDDYFLLDSWNLFYLLYNFLYCNNFLYNLWYLY